MGQSEIGRVMSREKCEQRGIFESPLQLLGRIRPAVFASALEISSGLRKPSPQTFTSFGGWGLLPEAPLIRGMPTEPKVFFAMLDACGLRPCDQTHLKSGLVPDLYAGGVNDEHHETCAYAK